MSDPRLSRRRFLRLAAQAGLIACTNPARVFAEIPRTTISGKVHATGVPLAGVRVSDSRQVARTDDQGNYRLTVGPDSGPFLFVTTPRDYWTQDFFVPLADAAARGGADFVLRPCQQSDRFRFVFWTDLHLEGGGERLRKFRDTVVETNSLQPAFVWAQGDISVDDGATADYLECISCLRVPIRNGLGNHDVTVGARQPRSRFFSVFGPSYYSFDWAGVHCVVLDGTSVVSTRKSWRSVHGEVSERELAWLAADLAATPVGTPIIVGIHIPLFSSYPARRPGVHRGKPAWVVKNAAAVHKLLSKYDVRLVLQGHLHENERILKDGIEYVESQAVAGTWWRSPGPIERGVDGAPRGFRVIDVDGKKVSHSFYSSAESHVDTTGEILGNGSLQQRCNSYIVFNCYDAPQGAAAEYRWDAGDWEPMSSHPVVNAELGLTKPHHFLGTRDTRGDKPGSHTVEVRTIAPTSRFHFRGRVRVEAAGATAPLVYCRGAGLADGLARGEPSSVLDVMTLLGVPELDLQTLILTSIGSASVEVPEKDLVAAASLCEATGSHTLVATGAAGTSAGRGTEVSAATEQLLATLGRSASPVTIVATGGLRDVARALVEDRATCERKIDRLYVSPAAPVDSRVDRDAVALLRSGLPIYWIQLPSVPTKSTASHPGWQRTFASLLRRLPIESRDGEPHTHFKTSPGLLPLALPTSWALLWSHVADRTLHRESGSWRARPWRRHSPTLTQAPFAFARSLVDISSTGELKASPAPPHYAIERLRVTDLQDFAAAGGDITDQALRELWARLQQT